MNLKIFGLTSGQELVALVKEQTADGYLITHCAIVFHQQGPRGELQSGFMPYMMNAVDGTVHLYNSTIGSSATADKALAMAHSQFFAKISSSRSNDSVAEAASRTAS